MIKNLLKKIVNSITIPPFSRLFISSTGKINPTWQEIKADSPKASENWDRLGLEKSYKYFIPVVIIFFLYLKSKIFEFVINLTSKFDVVNYQGESSPLTIVYKASALISIIDTSTTAIAIIYLFYFGYTLFKTKH